MTIEQAIQKAIEGGWHPQEYVGGWVSDVKILLASSDPSFWQSIVRALSKEDFDDEVIAITARALFNKFCDQLWLGKDAESFFETLTSSTKGVS